MKKHKRKKADSSEFWDAESILLVFAIILLVFAILIVGFLGYFPYMILAWIAAQAQKNSVLSGFYIPQILKFLGIITSCLWIVGLVSLGLYLFFY